MRYARVVPASVLVLCVLVGYMADRTHRPLSRPSAAADVGITRTVREDGPAAPAGFAEDDPWLPGMPGWQDPFAKPTSGPGALTIDELLRDVGVDIRGLGDNSAGIGAPGLGTSDLFDESVRGFGDPSHLVNLDDVTNGLSPSSAGTHRDTGIFFPGQSAGLDNGGSGLPPAAALNPSAGAFFNDGRAGDWRTRTENIFDTQWKSIMASMDRSTLPQVGAIDTWPSRRFRERIASARKGARPALISGLTNFRPPQVQRVGPDDVADEDNPLFGENEEPTRRAASRPTFGALATEPEAADLLARVKGTSVNLAVDDQEFQEVVKTLQIQTGHNIAIDPRIAAEINESPVSDLNLSDVSLATVLTILQNAAGEDVVWTTRGNVLWFTKRAFVEHDLQTGTHAAVEGKRTKPRTWRRAKATPNNARLMVGDKAELPLQSMDIAVHIDGFRARVVIDTFFLNPYDRNLNGTFQLRMPTGASPHYLAFGRTELEKPDVPATIGTTLGAIRAQRRGTWAPKEARMVSREQAAKAYTETIRQRIDPALMEWAGAGVFSTQVFPLEPGASHRIVVAYDIDLHHRDGWLEHVLDIPQDVPSLDVAVTTDRTFRYRNPTQQRLVTRVKDAAPFVLTGTSDTAGALFATQVTPALPARPVATARRAVFLLDTSASSNPERFVTWLALLRALLDENRGAIEEFAVGFFALDTRWWKPAFVKNTPEAVEELWSDADQLALEGATDIAQALTAANAKEGAFDVFLLSDGGATWGETHPHAIASRLDEDHACFGYVVPGGMADPALLGLLAQRSGGSVFPLLSEDEVRKVATAHAARPWVLEDVELDGTSDLLLAGAPAVLFPGQTLRLAGRGSPTADAEVVLRVRQGEDRRTLRMPLGTRRTSPLTARAYGEIAVAQLEGLGAAAAKEARAYASHFRVVGRSCSLLMLESEEDYQRRGVKPEDEAAVATAPASEILEARIAQALEELNDPKARFLARLDHLAALPAEHGLAVHPELRKALASLPASDFVFTRRKVERKQVLRHEAPDAIRDGTDAGRLDYDLAMAEVERRRRAHGEDDALAFLSTLVELAPGDLVLARDVALTAMAHGRTDAARDLLLRVGSVRPWERPTWLAVARCMVQAGQDALALPFFELAMNEANDRYGALARVAALDYEPVLYRVALGTQDDALRRFARARLRTVAGTAGLETADLVVVIEWNTDRTDVDLHVTDPTGEECYYEHRVTKMGANLSTDVRTGFGPELYVLKKAQPGAYTIEAKYYSGDGLQTQARSRVFARIIEDFGRSSERERRVTLVLKAKGDRNEIIVITRP